MKTEGKDGEEAVDGPLAIRNRCVRLVDDGRVQINSINK